MDQFEINAISSATITLADRQVTVDVEREKQWRKSRTVKVADHTNPGYDKVPAEIRALVLKIVELSEDL